MSANVANLNDVLGHIIRNNWRSHCPNAPECEVCGNLASIICYSCRVDKIREAREKKIRIGKHRYIKEVEKQAPSLMDATNKNRVGFCLCILCEKEIHSIAHRLGVSTLQEFQYQDERSNAIVRQCNSCQDTQRFDSPFYSTDGPVQTLVSSEHGKTVPAIKQLFICQRCYELSMLPPMTNKNMYHELKESKHFIDILNQSLRRELISYEKDLLAGFARKKILLVILKKLSVRCTILKVVLVLSLNLARCRWTKRQQDSTGTETERPGPYEGKVSRVREFKINAYIRGRFD